MSRQEPLGEQRWNKISQPEATKVDASAFVVDQPLLGLPSTGLEGGFCRPPNPYPGVSDHLQNYLQIRAMGTIRRDPGSPPFQSLDPNVLSSNKSFIVLGTCWDRTRRWTLLEVKLSEGKLPRKDFTEKTHRFAPQYGLVLGERSIRGSKIGRTVTDHC